MNVLTVTKKGKEITLSNNDQDGNLINSFTIVDNLISAQNIINLLDYKTDKRYEVDKSKTTDIIQIKPFVDFLEKLTTQLNLLNKEQK